LGTPGVDAGEKSEVLHRLILEEVSRLLDESVHELGGDAHVAVYGEGKLAVRILGHEIKKFEGVLT
jgi:hypothetical protein